jgi:hypothetical protein
LYSFAAFKTPVRWLIVTAAAAGAIACGPPPLAHTHPSADALATAVLDALARGDEPSLRALALDEQEFRRHVWPALPAARPERNLPFSYVWGDLHQKSTTFAKNALARHRGRRYALQGVTFEDGATDYAGFRVHRRAVFHVRDGAGAAHDLRVCGSFVEQAGAWKVFSYVAD